jgi:peptide-methionine (S)-S-oxide reductase
MSREPETAILAGGCFWGMQDLIRKQEGVISTRVGYTGGDVPNATYGNHGNHGKAMTSVPVTVRPSSTPATPRSELPRTPSPTSTPLGCGPARW